MEEIEDICRKLFYFTDRWKDYGRRMRDAEHTLIEALEINPLEDYSTTVGRYTIKYENSRLEVDEKIEPAEPVTMKMLEEENAPEWAKAAFKAFGEEE
jgi:hypothetical protein